jgi:hypothetical protein
MSKRKPSRPGRNHKDRPVTYSDGRPKVIAVIMAGNAESTIERAVRSVAQWVDRIFILDTGITDATLIKARAAAAHVPLQTRRWAWRNDFGAGRNAALHEAAKGAPPGAWLLILDTDEWYTWLPPMAPSVLAATLGGAAPETDAFLVPHFSGSYVQPRFVRASSVLDGKAKFSGAVHEAMSHNHAAQRTLAGLVAFNDEAKTPVQSLKKWRRDLKILEPFCRKNPEAQRERYYLGQTHECLGDLAKPTDEAKAAHHYTLAAAAYTLAARGTGWGEEGAWAAYKAAVLTSNPLGRQPTREERLTARAIAVAGLERYPIAELAWLAGYESFYLGLPAEALAFARMAIATGLAEQDGADLYGRTSFKDVRMLWEKPYELAAYAADKLKNPGLATYYREKAKAALTARGGV